MSSDKYSSPYKKYTTKCQSNLTNTEKNMAEHNSFPEEQPKGIQTCPSHLITEESTHLKEEETSHHFSQLPATIVYRSNSRIQPHPPGSIKEEPDLWEDAIDTNIYVQYSSAPGNDELVSCSPDLNISTAEVNTQYRSHIKKEAASCNRGTPADPDISMPTDHQEQYLSADIKEELPSWKDGNVSDKGDTEQYPAASGGGENLLDPIAYSPDLIEQNSSTCMKEEPVLREGGHLLENEIYAFTYTGEYIESNEDVICIKKEPQLVQGSKYIKHTSPSSQPAKTAYTCPVCQRSFNNHGNLVKHREAHKGKKPTCSICWEPFLTQSDLLVHQIQSHNIDKSTRDLPKARKSTCSKCGAKFSFKLDLLAHRKIHKINKCLYCSLCKKQFSCNSQLVIHQRSHTGEKPYKCSECGKQFSNKSNLAEHKRIHTGKKTFSCSDCGKCFSRKDNLISHQQKHEGDKTLTCSDCGRCFVNEHKFMKHQRFHAIEKPFSCSLCGKSFTHNAVLLRHQRSHANEKPYICCDCGKCFIQHGELVKHQRIHTGEKPFLCSECSKSFSTGSGLINHKKIHTTEKPFSCPKCGNSFKQKKHLIIHQRVHSGEKPYTCPDCAKGFTTKSNYNTHRKIHTVRRQLSCTQCGKQFPYKSQLKEHLKSHDPQE